MEYKEMTAKTVDEAITKACVELGITSDRLDYEVLNEGSSGFFGLGSHDAVIRYRERTEIEPGNAADPADAESPTFVTAEDIEARAAAAALRDKELGIVPEKKEYSGGRNDRRRGGRGGRPNNRRNSNRHDSDGIGRVIEEEKPHEPSVPKPDRVISEKTEEEVTAIKKTAREFLEGVFAAMKMDVNIEMEYDQKEGALNCEFTGEEMGILIGKRGQTLDSLQYLTSLCVNKGEDEYIRVKLDTEDYRNRRKATLENLSRNIAFKVRKSRKAIALEPMNPYERRIIHAALQKEDGIETYSDGDEPYRHVVVTNKKS